jgi:ferrous iron transport protein A
MVKIINRIIPLPSPAASRLPEGVVVTLDALPPGQAATISHVTADAVAPGSAALKLHLLELGFVAGSPITFLMSTPFGDPGIYSLRGTSIALRKSEARCVHVKI